MDSWKIPCNPYLYDVVGAFRCLETIDWRKIVKKIDINDTVYIYAGRPIQSITHKCVVVKTDIPYSEAEDSDDQCKLSKNGEKDLQPYEKYMRLRLVRE